jgi:acetyl coenzyme A synthetase (ADP forming)-like protein
MDAVVLRDGGSVLLRERVEREGEEEGILAVVREGEAEQVVGVAGYHRRGPELAEFALNVASEHLGRGIGTLLLEHLGERARSRGIEVLQTRVLTGDLQMVRLLTDLGAEVSPLLDSQVADVRLSTRPTPRSAAASTWRERMASAASLQALFAPRTIAVVGASRREGSIGRALVENLLGREFRGQIFPVNPQAAEVGGLVCHASVQAIGEHVDLAVIAVPAPQVEPALADCARAGVRCVVVISAGFAEVGQRAAQDRLVELVRGAGMRMVGPNCMGVLSTAPGVSMDATFAPGWPPAGNISFLSQSGALGIAILEHAARRGLGLADFVSVGNRADVSSNDLIAYWGQSERTAVIALYLESIGNPRKFARIAPEVARQKPIVAVKAGRSAAGTRAAASHSAALAGLDVAVDALFAQAGVLRVDTMEQLFDLAALLSCQPVPQGPRVGVVTNAGGPGILFADTCEARGLSVPTLGEETLAELRSFLPPQAGLSNPVDLIASATPEQFQRAVACVGRDPGVDSLVAIYVPPMVTRPEQIASAIAAGAGQVPADKPILAVFLSHDSAPGQLSQGPRGKIPSYSFPENAAIALSAASRYGQWLRRPQSRARSLSPGQERAVREALARATPDPDGWLPLPQVAELLQLVGVAFAPFEVAAPEPEASAAAAQRLGGPVVLKMIAPGLLHKTEVGGVALDLRSPEAVRQAAEVMLQRARDAGYAPQGLLVQRQVGEGVEALVGMTTDRDLGPVVVAGLGGVHVELLRDVAFGLVPVTELDAQEMLGRLRTAPLLSGFRGAPVADQQALVDCILQLSALVEVAPELAEIELNPVRVLRQGEGALAVDARARMRR